MLITAKYPATCCTCHRPVAPGAKIEWAKGAPVRHATCGSTATAPATRPAASRYPREGQSNGRGASFERGVGMVCDECGEKAVRGTRCWETGMTH